MAPPPLQLVQGGKGAESETSEEGGQTSSSNQGNQSAGQSENESRSKGAAGTRDTLDFLKKQSASRNKIFNPPTAGGESSKSIPSEQASPPIEVDKEDSFDKVYAELEDKGFDSYDHIQHKGDYARFIWELNSGVIALNIHYKQSGRFFGHFFVMGLSQCEVDGKEERFEDFLKKAPLKKPEIKGKNWEEIKKSIGKEQVSKKKKQELNSTTESKEGGSNRGKRNRDGDDDTQDDENKVPETGDSTSNESK